MTKKQIEKKAKEIVSRFVPNEDDDEFLPPFYAQKAAICMADWALSQQWVSVEDELPKDKQNVFIRLADGRSTSGWYSHSIEEWFISIGEIGGDDCLYERVTHWMPIPPLAEEGGEKK